MQKLRRVELVGFGGRFITFHFAWVLESCYLCCCTNGHSSEVVCWVGFDRLRCWADHLCPISRRQDDRFSKCQDGSGSNLPTHLVVVLSLIVRGYSWTLTVLEQVFHAVYVGDAALSFEFGGHCCEFLGHFFVVRLLDSFLELVKLLFFQVNPFK